MIINTRADLENASQAERNKFVAMLAGTINRWSWSGDNWVLGQDTSQIEAFGYTLDDFSDAPVPGKPAHKPNRVTQDDVIAERQRRLALGFTYDFGDGRGVHKIGTTPSDMEGWDEVNKGATARHALGVTTPISIVTNTGPVEVTPAEWLAILDAATAFRQPIWHASFALQAMDPIPADYADNKHWPA